MPYTVTYDPDSSFVVTVMEGKMSIEELIAEEEQSIALAIENGTRKFLVDLVDYESSLSSAQIYEFPVRYQEKLERPIYVAIVEPLSKEARVEASFYETVCRNRGWNVTDLREQGRCSCMVRRALIGLTPEPSAGEY